LSPAAREKITASIDEGHRYPYEHYHELTELIAARENLSPTNVILGAGSTEVLTSLLHFYKASGEIVAAEPTYYDFLDYAQKAECSLSLIPLNARFEHDLEAMEKKINGRTGLVYICNPNNPTGSITPRDELREFCQWVSKKALVVVDEAYHEYAEDPGYGSMAGLVREGENIIVTRTFSKVYGLAGLRVGYGMAGPQVLENLRRIERNFAPVSCLSLRAAIAAYQDLEFVQKVKHQNQEVKSFLFKELKKMGFETIGSETNFVLFRVGRDSQELAEELEKRSILVRPFHFQGSYWIRVSLGTFREINTFLARIKEIEPKIAYRKFSSSERTRC
jgi:histidinol-phosphate aminotransferase